MIAKFIIKTAGNFLFIIGVSVALFTYMPILYSEIGYYLANKDEVGMSIIEQPTYTEQENIDEAISHEYITPIKPSNEDFSVIINKIDVNAPVVPDVTMVDQSEYMKALRYGVAHAKGTPYPGQPGNSFYFAHSSLNFWQLGPYATVFNLLRKLEMNDTITLFYKGKPYVYRVFEMETVPGWNTTPFVTDYEEPIITLVTCDPPGSTINRYIVKAKLVSVLR